MELNREDFIKQFISQTGQSHPPLPQELAGKVCSVRDFLQWAEHKNNQSMARNIVEDHREAPTSAPEWVGGRFQAAQNSLVSDGACLQLVWSDKVKTFAENLRDRDILAVSGDYLVQQKQFLVLQARLLLVSDRDSRVNRNYSYNSTRLSSGCDYQDTLRWSVFLSAVREFFTKQNFLEVNTPLLCPAPGTEVFISPMSVQVTFNGRQETRFLPTSPEFHLKKMLVAGWTRIFEIARCFRNQEMGAHHQPEFWMIEWYRAYSNLLAIRQDVKDLILFLCEKLQAAGIGLRNGGNAPFIREVTIRSLFQEYLGFELTPQTSKHDLLQLAQRLGIDVDVTNDWDDIYFNIFISHIESKLPQDEVYIVYDYPPSQSALARLTSDGWADRFEVYWGGFEIANAFHELNDPVENRKRMEKDLAERLEHQGVALPIDEELLQGIEFGLPPSGGIALGLERLFMALLKIEDWGQVRPFPFSTSVSAGVTPIRYL